MVLNDKWIIDMATNHGMITPFEPGQVRVSEAGEKILSYGTSSYGYDIRCAPVFKVFTNVRNAIVDPKNFSEDSFVHMEGDSIIIPPNSFILGHSVEYLKIPRNALALVIGKSTLARVGCVCLATPLEPEWEGHITLEFANTTSLPMRFYANEGCAQLVFLDGGDCNTSYKDRGGKYQGQTGVTFAKP